MGSPLLCELLANNFIGHSSFLALCCMITTVILKCHSVTFPSTGVIKKTLLCKGSEAISLPVHCYSGLVDGDILKNWLKKEFVHEIWFKVYLTNQGCLHTLNMRSSLFWYVVQYRLVMSYQCFRTNYQSSPQGSRGCPNRSVTTNLHCATSQKSKDLIYIVVKAWNPTMNILFLMNIFQHYIITYITQGLGCYWSLTRWNIPIFDNTVKFF